MPSSIQQDIESLVESGMEPLVLDYETVKQFASPRIILRSTLRIQTPHVGTLEQEQYRYVARRTSQSEQLFKRQLHKVVQQLPDLMKQIRNLQTVTIPVYSRMLKKGNLASSIFDELTAHPNVSAANLCVEVSADILFEELEPLAAELQKVRKMGVKIALWELGDPDCPLLQLRNVPYDYIFLDSYAVSLLPQEETEREFEAICHFLHVEEKTKVFAPDFPDVSLCEKAEQLGCDGYSLGRNAPAPADEEEDA